MLHQKTVAKLCSVYFLSMFSVSIFINLALVRPTSAPVNSTEIALQPLLNQLILLETQYTASLIPIQHEDLTGIKGIVEKKRNRKKQREERLAQQQQRRQHLEVALVSTSHRAHTAAAVASPEEDPHGNSAHYSKTFVPFDKDIPAIPVEYTETSKKFTAEQIRTTITDVAKKHLGTRYKWAGKKPGGFDCSGFTSWLMSQYGISISGSSRHQALQGNIIPMKEAKTGDLIFFSRYGRGGRVTHVALVVENTQNELYVIHAVSRGIVIDNIYDDKYWEPKILYARDVITR